MVSVIYHCFRDKLLNKVKCWCNRTLDNVIVGHQHSCDNLQRTNSKQKHVDIIRKREQSANPLRYNLEQMDLVELEAFFHGNYSITNFFQVFKFAHHTLTSRNATPSDSSLSQSYTLPTAFKPSTISSGTMWI